MRKIQVCNSKYYTVLQQRGNFQYGGRDNFRLQFHTQMHYPVYFQISGPYREIQDGGENIRGSISKFSFQGFLLFKWYKSLLIAFFKKTHFIAKLLKVKWTGRTLFIEKQPIRTKKNPKIWKLFFQNKLSISVFERLCYVLEFIKLYFFEFSADFCYLFSQIFSWLCPLLSNNSSLPLN